MRKPKVEEHNMMTVDEFRGFSGTQAEKAFNDDLQCYLKGMTLSAHGEVILWLGENSATDMVGAIRLATRVFPWCEVIRTMTGNVPDTLYARRNGKWFAFYPDDTENPVFPDSGYRPER